jgi:undecaprenyl diphosphate synthase
MSGAAGQRGRRSSTSNDGRPSFAWDDAYAATATDNGQPATPRYVAIITDGNSRWARIRSLSTDEGHDAGALTLKARVGDAIALGIEQLTVYAFSTENWSRPAEDVTGLLCVLAKRTASETPDLDRDGVRMRFIGRRDGVGRELLEQIRRSEELTAENRRITLFVALNYGGRAEIIDAARRFEGTDEAQFRTCLYDREMHDPDVVIRTGGERRLSNFLLWQSAYAELVFRDELWPDFTRQAFVESLEEFRSRKRRFGGRKLEVSQ